MLIDLGDNSINSHSQRYVFELIFDVLRNPKWRRRTIVVSFVVIGAYLMLTQGGEIKTERVVFVGWNVQGYGFYTTGYFDVCTDPLNEEETTISLYRHSLGSWSPIDHLDQDDDMDMDAWYLITYQQTILGKKLLRVEIG